MNAHADPHAARRHRVPFLIWGWAMLLVVLMSAAPTGAQARVRLVGSALDPASVSVALSPKQPKAKETASKAPSRGLPDEASPPPLAIESEALAPPPLADAALGGSVPGERPPVLHPALSQRSNGARAPPLS